MNKIFSLSFSHSFSPVKTSFKYVYPLQYDLLLNVDENFIKVLNNQNSVKDFFFSIFKENDCT